MRARVRACWLCVCVCACVRACVRACVCVCECFSQRNSREGWSKCMYWRKKKERKRRILLSTSPSFFLSLRLFEISLFRYMLGGVFAHTECKNVIINSLAHILMDYLPLLEFTCTYRSIHCRLRPVLWRETERERDRDRETQRDTERQRERERELEPESFILQG